MGHYSDNDMISFIHELIKLGNVIEILGTKIENAITLVKFESGIWSEPE